MEQLEQFFSVCIPVCIGIGLFFVTKWTIEFNKKQKTADHFIDMMHDALEEKESYKKMLREKEIEAELEKEFNIGV